MRSCTWLAAEEQQKWRCVGTPWASVGRSNGYLRLHQMDIVSSHLVWFNYRHTEMYICKRDGRCALANSGLCRQSRIFKLKWQFWVNLWEYGLQLSRWWWWSNHIINLSGSHEDAVCLDRWNGFNHWNGRTVNANGHGEYSLLIFIWNENE